MMLYFIGGVVAIDAEGLRARGLGHVADGTFSVRGVSRGPSGEAGVIVGAGMARVELTELGYFPERQEWQEAVSAACWLGWGKDCPPGPAVFLRDRALAGHPVTMGDGKQWVAPVALSIGKKGDGHPQIGHTLPSVSVMTPDGWRRVCQPKYRDLLDLAFDVFKRCCAIDEAGYIYLNAGGTAEDDALTALRANYRISALEASALGLLTDDAIIAVLSTLVDMQSWGAEKKTARDGGNTSPGAEAT